MYLFLCLKCLLDSRALSLQVCAGRRGATRRSWQHGEGPEVSWEEELALSPHTGTGNRNNLWTSRSAHFYFKETTANNVHRLYTLTCVCMCVFVRVEVMHVSRGDGL